MDDEMGSDVIPFAKQHFRQMKTQGKYAGGYPKGAVVHFTAGRFEKGIESAQAAIEEGIKNNYAYLCIATDGTILQAHPISEWGYHCGESSWTKVPEVLQLRGSLSDDLIGIEICGPGKLTYDSKSGYYKTWYGAPISPFDIREVSEESWNCPSGAYHPFTPAQEVALTQLLIWLKKNDPLKKFSFDHVLGHHEISGKIELGYWRKCDPGGSLSMPMERFRDRLKSIYDGEMS